MKESASCLRPFGVRTSSVVSSSLLGNGQNSGVKLNASLEMMLCVGYEKEDLGLRTW